MKRLAMLVMTCVVVDQLKSATGWLTTCKGAEIDGVELNGQVVFDEQYKHGKTVQYTPFIVPDDEIIHGRISGIVSGIEVKPQETVSDHSGKRPDGL